MIGRGSFGTGLRLVHVSRANGAYLSVPSMGTTIHNDHFTLPLVASAAGLHSGRRRHHTDPHWRPGRIAPKALKGRSPVRRRSPPLRGGPLVFDTLAHAASVTVPLPLFLLFRCWRPRLSVPAGARFALPRACSPCPPLDGRVRSC